VLTALDAYGDLADVYSYNRLPKNYHTKAKMPPQMD
jgi:hypothetical protein